MNPPTRLNNRYQVLNVLGEGGFGTTYLVEDTQMPSNRRCVVKQLKPVHHDPKIYQMVQDRFKREAAILEKLGEAHNQIPRLYAYFSEADQFYLVEEWIEGDTLTQKVQKEGLQSEASVRSLLTNLLPAIAYIHSQGIVHRDIKPDNIIVRHRDGKPVLIDFGAVKESMSTMINSQGNSSHSIVVGTPGYMPAEQLSGRPVFASDLYGLGMTAIYLLTGRTPQELDNDPHTGEVQWRGFAPQISDEFAAFLNRAIHMNAFHRYSSAHDMLTALNALPMGGVVTAPPYPMPVQQPQPQTAQTQISAPQNYTSAPVIPAESSGTSPWKKAVIIGGIVGVSALVGTLVIRSQSPNLQSSAPTPTVTASATPSDSPTPTPTSTPIVQAPPTPVETPDPPKPSEKPQVVDTSDTNASIAGSGSKNIRSGAGTNYNVIAEVRAGDRVKIVDRAKDSGGFVWFKVSVPGSNAEGWIAEQLLSLDEPAPDPEPVETPTPKPSEKPSEKPPTQSDKSDAVIIGNPGATNIRSGPGTKYGVRHIAYPGDRIQILESGQDPKGDPWYKVRFPKSGAEGWISGQLVQPD
jgi:serine/threonine protein kinase, bacterial